MHQSKETRTAYSTSMLIRDTRDLIRPYRTHFLVAAFIRTLSDVARLYPPYAFAAIVTLLAAQSGIEASMPAITRFLAFTAVAFTIHIVCRESAKFMGFQVSERVGLDAQVRTIGHLFSLDLSWHERENSGNKLKRMQKGGQGLEEILRICIVNLIEVTVNFVGIIVIIALFDLRISIVLLCFMAIYYALSTMLIRRAVRMEQVVSVEEEQLQGIAFESINNIRSVKVLGMAVPLLQRIRRQAALLFASIRKRIFWYRTRDLVLVVYGRTFFLGSVTFVIWSILHGRYEVGFLVLYAQYFDKLWENIDEISRVTQNFMVAKVGVSRMMDILHEPIGIDTESGKASFPKEWDSIEIRNLTFSYVPDRPVLKNLSFTIKRGEKIGIVGVSGAGKSTLFKVLLKEHERYGGEILIGSQPLRSISRSSFFKKTAVVLQDTEVFNFSLRDNITIANTDAAKNEELLTRSIGIAHVQDFMKKLPEGIETFIGEKGVKLSGGEKQRVGIARAVFKEPEILFLDEATSHLDLESEENIQDSLHRFFRSVTAVVIAHRLSTIKEMDRILVLEHGTIIESGTFEELFAKKGRFFELWEKQKF